MGFSFKAVVAATLAGLSAAAEMAPRSAFTEVADGMFGPNESGAKMFLYVPEKLAARPPVVVGIHWCHGTAFDYYRYTGWAGFAEEHGFVVVYPESPHLATDGCWDVSSAATLTHGGGGNSNSIADMVETVLEQYGGDGRRVYVTGISSGAMMTNVMAAAYPSLFSAGVVYSGVPPTCFMSADPSIADYWNGTCASGGVTASPEYWAGAVENMNPGYRGRRPRLQIYHGDSDEVLNFANYGETIKLWSAVLGYGEPKKVLPDTPFSPFTKYVYGSKLQGIVGAGVPHNIQHNETEDLAWFGLDKSWGS